MAAISIYLANGYYSTLLTLLCPTEYFLSHLITINYLESSWISNTRTITVIDRKSSFTDFEYDYIADINHRVNIFSQHVNKIYILLSDSFNSVTSQQLSQHWRDASLI